MGTDKHRFFNTKTPRRKGCLTRVARINTNSKARKTNLNHEIHQTHETQSNCAEAVTEISPGFERSEYPGKTSRKIKFPRARERENWPAGLRTADWHPG